MIEQVEIKYTSSPHNLVRVPQKQWRKWNVAGRKVFNELYSSMQRNQRIFSHPKQGKLQAQQWKTLCWNAAWIAASSATNAVRKK